MADYAAHRLRCRGVAAWCRSFVGVTQSPEHRALPAVPSTAVGGRVRKLPPKSPSSVPASFHSSSSSKLAVLIDPSRILSSGRVSPIDLDDSPAVAMSVEEGEASREQQAATVVLAFMAVREEEEEEEEGSGLDLKLCLRGRDRRCVVMELESTVLCESSAFFADIVPTAGAGAKRTGVDGVDNVVVFKEAVELMFERDALR